MGTRLEGFFNSLTTTPTPSSHTPTPVVTPRPPPSAPPPGSVVYPNPVTLGSTFHLLLPDASARVKATLYTTAGRKAASWDLDAPGTGRTDWELDLKGEGGSFSRTGLSPGGGTGRGEEDIEVDGVALEARVLPRGPDPRVTRFGRKGGDWTDVGRAPPASREPTGNIAR